ncbi:hypothetical protein [Cohnella soli]|uniref:Uncharacterized protein n=1 Tax=Cohnella soli TaxID=425005 RepID=A0ABW0I3G7_9BACL
MSCISMQIFNIALVVRY